MGNITAPLDQDKLLHLSRVVRSERASDAYCVARQVESRSRRGSADQARPNFWPNVWLILAPPLRQIGAFELIDVNRQNGVCLLRQPLAFARGLERKRQDDPQQHEDRNDAEVEFPQLLFVDLAGEQDQLRPVLQMSIHGLPAAAHFLEQMRRVRWGDALRREMTPDVQISGIFSLLDCLMTCACFSNRFLLGAAALVQGSIARFKFTPNALNIFLYDGKFRFRSDQFLLGEASRICAAETGSDKFSALFREAGTTCAYAC